MTFANSQMILPLPLPLGLGDPTLSASVLMSCQHSDINALISVDNNDNFEPEISIKENLSAPIKKGDVVGSVTYKIDGLKYTADLLAGNDVEVAENGIFIVFVIIIGFVIIIFMIRFVNKKKRYRLKRNKYR